MNFQTLVGFVESKTIPSPLTLLEARMTKNPLMSAAYEIPIGRTVREIPETGYYYLERAIKLYKKNMAEKNPGVDPVANIDARELENAIQLTYNEMQSKGQVAKRLEKIKSTGDVVAHRDGTKPAKKYWDSNIKMFKSKEEKEAEKGLNMSLDEFEAAVKDAIKKYGAGEVGAGVKNENDFVQKFGNVTYTNPTFDRAHNTFIYKANKNGYELEAVVDASLTDGEPEPTVQLGDEGVILVNVFVNRSEKDRGSLYQRNPDEDRIYTYSKEAVKGLGDEDEDGVQVSPSMKKARSILSLSGPELAKAAEKVKELFGDEYFGGDSEEELHAGIQNAFKDNFDETSADKFRDELDEILNAANASPEDEELVSYQNDSGVNTGEEADTAWY